MSLFSKQSQPSSSGGYQVLNEPPSPSPSQAPTLPRQGDNMSYYSSVPSASPQGSRGPTPGPDQYRHPTANPFASTPASDSEHSYHDMLPAQGSSAQDTLYSRGSDRKEPFSPWAHSGPEDDDALHDPDVDNGPKGIAALCTWRGLENLGCMFIMIVVLVTLFAAYPIISELTTKTLSTAGGFNLGGVNATGQLPDLNQFRLIDADTPESAYTHKSFEDGSEWQLVFSDEFNRPGRTFYEGDDPYWSAVDLHYWGTNNLEWYDPRAVYTENGHLTIQFTHSPNLHGMNFTGGMISTWNRFCFTGGYIEAAVSLPATSQIPGMWPAVWTMGNLGRAGYGGSLEGTWPYSYDECDVGTLLNQTLNGEPQLDPGEGDQYNGDSLSYLPGQRLSACTCPDDPLHPGPKRADGSFVGRAAPEIDMLEATIFNGYNPDPSTRFGEVSMSGQWAPFNPSYEYINTSKTTTLYDNVNSFYNDYLGGVFQQATSVLARTDANCYTNATGCFSRFGFEYLPGDDGYITWVGNGTRVWQIRQAAMGPNSRAQVGQRLVSVEPMYIIINLGLSENFGAVDYESLLELYPIEMWVDYIRVYQDPKLINIGCDPEDYPTADYIQKLAPAFSNPNITTFEQLKPHVDGLLWPKNRLTDTC